MNVVTEWMQSHTGGQTAAILSKVCGGDTTKLDTLLCGESEVRLKEVFKKLFDRRGRRIPEDLSASVCDANSNFRLDQPVMDREVDYANRIMRLHECLGIDTGVTGEQLEAEIRRLFALIMGNSQIAGIANGVRLPVVLPQLTADNLGTALEQYLKAAGKSYAKTFSDREFYSHRKGTLAGAVSIMAGSRHDQLIERMEQGLVMGIHFPNSLQGFSVNASREQMATLSESFILSGLDTAIAMAMYPDILARDWHTPGLDLAAFSWRSAGYSLGFKADDGELRFVNLGSLAGAGGSCSGGLLFVGPQTT